MEIQSVGSLSEHPFAHILLWVAQTSFSGVLVLARESIKKSFIFENGKIVSARSNMPSEILGTILLEERKISPADLKKSLQELEGKTSVRQGEVLLTMGLIDQASLAETLEKQLIRRVEEVFQWTQGRYGFVDRIPEDVSKVPINRSLIELCFRGLIGKYREHVDSSSLDTTLKPITVGGQKWDVSQMRLVGREMGLFRAINGVNSIQQIIDTSRIDAGQAKAMLLAYRDMGLIRLGDRPVVTFDQTQKKPPAARQARKSGGNTEMDQMLERFAKQSHFEILGVAKNASANDVKAAYFALAKKYHPDRAPPDMGPEERKTWEDIFAHISEAHSILTNDERRKEYVASLEVAETGMDASQDAQNILQSELEFQKAGILIKKGDFSGAIAMLETAIRLYDQEPEYSMLMGWAQYKKGSKTSDTRMMKKGKELIEAALSKNPKLVQGYYYSGLIAKADGDLSHAKRYFEKTLEFDSRHNEAASELRFLNMRKAKQETGGFKGLFRKKGD